MTASWVALDVEVTEEVGEELIALLDADLLGATSSPRAEGRVLVRLVLAPGVDAAAARTATANWLARRDPLAAERLRSVVVADDHWVERYQASLTPFELGRRFTVWPNGGAPDEPRTRIPLILVPGRAFGTGEHATTQLCVEALEVSVGAGEAWLDLGCGSGVLAMVARHCGAGRVRAIDNDPEAVAVAHEVLAANGMASDVELLCAQAQDRPLGVWDGIVANLETPYFLDAAPQLAKGLRAGGRLLASGLLVEDLDDVASALTAAGLYPTVRQARGEWALLIAERRGSAPLPGL